MKKVLIVLGIALAYPTAAQQNSVVSKQELETMKKEASAIAQLVDTIGWQHQATIGATFAQAAFSNWSGGGQNAVSLTTVFDFVLRYGTVHSVWESRLRLGYGFLTQEETGFRKTDDKIELVSRFGLNAFPNWLYTGLLTFRTQFAPGYRYPDDTTKISDFFAPAYVSLAVGMNYQPDFPLSLFLSPLTAKITIVLDQQLADAGAYGVEGAVYDQQGVKQQDGKKIRAEFGGSMQLNYQVQLMDNVQYSTVLSLFTNYLHNPQNLDVIWDHVITLKVNQYLAAVVTINAFYDDDVHVGIDDDDDGTVDRFAPRLQLKEILSIGFNYRF